MFVIHPHPRRSPTLGRTTLLVGRGPWLEMPMQPTLASSWPLLRPFWMPFSLRARTRGRLGLRMIDTSFLEFISDIPKCQIPSCSINIKDFAKWCKMLVFCVVIVSLSHVWKTLGLTPAPLMRLLCPKVGIYRIPTSSSWYGGMRTWCFLFWEHHGLWAHVKIPLGANPSFQFVWQSLRMSGHQSARLLASQWLESTAQATRTGSLVKHCCESLVLTELGTATYSNHPIPMDSAIISPRNLAVAASVFASFSGRWTAGEFGTFTEFWPWNCCLTRLASCKVVSLCSAVSSLASQERSSSP